MSAFDAITDDIAYFTAASKHGGGEPARASFDKPKASRKNVVFENMMAFDWYLYRRCFVSRTEG